jgi:hypothetical protein
MPTNPNPAHTRNAAGQYLCLCVCGVEFWATRFNAKFCCQECRLKAKRVSEKKPRPPVSVTNTCEICGVRFVGSIKYRSYASCGSPECRLEVRRRRGQGQAEKAKKKRLKRSCLRCGKLFDSQHKFNRLCPECRQVNSDNRYVENWGAVI